MVCDVLVLCVVEYDVFVYFVGQYYDVCIVCELCEVFEIVGGEYCCGWVVWCVDDDYLCVWCDGCGYFVLVYVEMFG